MQEFELIKGIKFTSREIDIISCIISGGSAKSIASLLDISTNTVNSHIKNIMLKIGGSSMGSIIKFIETSKDHFQIQKKYIDLISINEFEQVLSRLNMLILKKIKCEIAIVSGSVNISFLIKKHVSIITNLDVKIKSLDESERFCEKNENIFIFYEKQELFDYFKTFLQIINSLCNCEKIQSVISNFLFSIKDRYITNSIGVNRDRNDNTPCPKKQKTYSAKLIFSCVIVPIIFLILYINQNWISNETLSNIKQMPEIFINRHALQNKILETMSSSKNKIKVLVLTGVGGAGKTTLARNFLLNKNSSIIWEINAETEYNMINSFSDLANCLCRKREKKELLDGIRSINDFNERKKRIINFVFRELKQHDNWYLLFDNAENFDSIKDCIPNNSKVCGSGGVVITTRNEALTNNVYFKQSNVVNVGLLSKEDQIDLFCKIMYGSKENTLSDKLIDIKKLLQTIPMMPLDVITAAYYIKNTNTSFENYISNGAFVDRKINDLQKNFLSECAEYKKTRYDIIKVSFDNIRKVDAKFTELLLFICLIDPQNITKKLLNMLANPVIVDKFIYELKKQSLITAYENETFGIHRSIQEIGLNYMLTALTKEEKITYMDEIIKTMTPYENLVWIWYPHQRFKMNIKDRREMLLNLESISNKIIKLACNDKEKEYETKLLLALLYTYDDVKSYSQMIKIADRIFELNKNNACINGLDLIALLLENMYDCFKSGDINLVKNKSIECLELCKCTKNSEHARAICLAFLGRYYFCCGDEKNGTKYFNESTECLKNLTDKNSNAARAMICGQFYKSFGNHYINKRDTYKAIDFLIDTINKLGFSKFIHKNPKSIDSVPSHIAGLRVDLARAYNKIGDFDKAEENENEVLFLYAMKEGDTGIAIPLKKAMLGKECGQTLLRKNKLKKAYKMLSESIDVISQLGSKYELSSPFVYRSEVNLRLGRLNEAYADCISSLKTKIALYFKTPYTYLKEATCYYNMAIIKYKQKDFKKSIEHINDFMKKINEFCLSFLEKDIYKRMVNQNVFKCATNSDDLTLALKNCEIIFSAIYGENHSFVKDFVAKNLAN